MNSRPKTHYLFIALVIAFIVMAIMNVLPFPILVVVLLMSWCGLALVVMLFGRMRERQRPTHKSE